MWLTAFVQPPERLVGAGAAAKAGRMRAVLLVLLVLLFVPGWTGERRLDLLSPGLSITTSPVPLDPDDSSRRRVGALTYLGGVELRSPDLAFGGVSALHVAGERFTLLDDGGNVVQFHIASDWRVRGIKARELPDGPGPGWEKLDRDSESLAVSPDGRQLWVGFERANAIWRYSEGFMRVEGAVRPRAMRRWPANAGPESMARLSDGSFIVISEGATRDNRPGVTALWFAGDPITTRRGFGFRFVPPAGYAPTDMVELPGARALLVLVRRFDLRGFTSRLMLVRRADIRPLALVRGREIARFEHPLPSDNFEALALSREGGRTILWIASDDNQSWWQRTLLLKFALPAKWSEPARAPPSQR